LTVTALVRAFRHIGDAFDSPPPQAQEGLFYGLALEGISAPQVAALNAQEAEGRG
jgi:hypothetical protein